MNQNSMDTPCWYVIHTNVRQEDRADRNLRGQHVETLNPKIMERRSNPYSAKTSFLPGPLFPRYIFAKFSLARMLQKVHFTRGVHDVVGFGAGPTPVDDEIISMITDHMCPDGFVRIGNELQKGDRVVIEDGPFKNFEGIFESEVKQTDRIVVLLNAVRYQSRIQIGKDQVKRFDESRVHFQL